MKGHNTKKWQLYLLLISAKITRMYEFIPFILVCVCSNSSVFIYFSLRPLLPLLEASNYYGRRPSFSKFICYSPTWNSSYIEWIHCLHGIHRVGYWSKNREIENGNTKFLCHSHFLFSWCLTACDLSIIL